MGSCAIDSCGNYFSKCKKNGKNVAFFRIPGGSIGETWKEICQIQASRKGSRICSEHFTDSQFSDETRRFLRPGEIPTTKLNLGVNSAASTFQIGDAVHNQLKGQLHTLSSKVKKLQLVLKHQKARIQNQNRVIQKLQDSRNRILITKKSLKEKNSILSKSLQARKNYTSYDTLKKCFTDTQIRMLQMDKQKIRWSEEDITKAIVLKAFSERKIWIFYDLPHLIKRLRDNTLDHVITLADGTTFSKADFWKIIDSDKNEMKICHKLTEKHLTLYGRERMRVRPAMQLYSGSVARCLTTFFGFDPRLKRLAEFIELVNDFVDLMNTRHTDQDNYQASPRQIEVLEKMEREISGLRVGKANHLMPFQIGFLYSIRSLKGLFEEMTQPPLNAKYIITSHLNTDINENGFGVMRGMGRFNDHPTVTDITNRLKMLMLGWTFTPSKNCPTHAEKECQPFLTSGLLKSLITEDTSKTQFHVSEEILARLENIDPLVSHVINQESWTEYHNSHSFTGRFGFNAQEYIYGFIVSKFRDKYPDMIMDSNIRQRFPQSWTQTSGSNLSLPSYTWLNIFIKLEEYFIAYHERQLEEKFDVNRSPSVLKNLNLIIECNFPDIPAEVIQAFVRIRTMIRIKAINNELKKRRFGKLNKNVQFVKSSVPSDVRLETNYPEEAFVEENVPDFSEEVEVGREYPALPNFGSDFDAVMNNLEDLTIM